MIANQICVSNLCEGKTVEKKNEKEPSLKYLPLLMYGERNNYFGIGIFDLLPRHPLITSLCKYSLTLMA